MYKLKVSKSDQSKLYLRLDSLCKSVQKRSVNYLIQAHSDYCAAIEIQVAGKRLIGKKVIILYYMEKDEEWVAVCDLEEYHMNNLNEISTIIRQKIQQIITIAAKL